MVGGEDAGSVMERIGRLRIWEMDKDKIWDWKLVVGEGVKHRRQVVI